MKTRTGANHGTNISPLLLAPLEHTNNLHKIKSSFGCSSFNDDGIEWSKLEGCLFLHPSRYFILSYPLTVLTASWTSFSKWLYHQLLPQESVSMSAAFSALQSTLYTELLVEVCCQASSRNGQPIAVGSSPKKLRHSPSWFFAALHHCIFCRAMKSL